MNLIENLYIQQSEVDHFKTMNQRYIGKMQEQQDQIAELKAQGGKNSKAVQFFT